MSSDKDPTTMHGMGAQMVLERNLGAQPLDTEDEDTQDNFPPHHGSPQSSSRDRTKDEEAEDEEDEVEEESRNIHAQRRLSSGIHVSRTKTSLIYQINYLIKNHESLNSQSVLGRRINRKKMSV